MGNGRKRLGRAQRWGLAALGAFLLLMPALWGLALGLLPYEMWRGESSPASYYVVFHFSPWPGLVLTALGLACMVYALFAGRKK